MVIRPHWPAWLTGLGKIGQLIIEGPVLWGHHTILPSPWDSVQKSTVLSHPVLRHDFSNHCIPVHCTLYTPGHITSVGGSHRQLLLSSHPQRPLRSGSGVSQFLLIWERKGTYQKEIPAQKSILPHSESLSCCLSGSYCLLCSPQGSCMYMFKSVSPTRWELLRCGAWHRTHIMFTKTGRINK